MIKAMSPLLWSDVIMVSKLVPTGYAATLVGIWDTYSTRTGDLDGSLAYAIERTFWESHAEPGSRHYMFYEVFGAGP